MKKTVALLFGGVSSEYAVSCVSAACVADNINKEVYDVRLLGITQDGKWYLYTGDTDSMRNHTWDTKADCLIPAVISPSSTHHGILLEDGTVIYVDAVFPVLHGKNGEDGTMQGLLALSGIPYVGCNTYSSAVCMDKVTTKILCEKVGIPVVPYVFFRKNGFCPEDAVKECEENLSYPMFVKPANAGSSVGITKANNRDELVKGFEIAFDNDYKVLVETGVKNAREIEVAMLGNKNACASVCGEIAPGADFYDYETKYVADTASYYVPARISDVLSENIRACAEKIYRTLDCAGLSRVDFFLDEKDVLYFNEINTIPGFTPISMYPGLMGKCGYSYSALIEKLIENACEEKL
ncbi:MAG: D-alanine--D-alanine ligase [Clostridia bacterium]|nr:D-alanine--D-alanine ligase [Clostridia bacterium]